MRARKQQFVRRVERDANGERLSGPIGRVIRTSRTDEGEVAVLVGWPEGARWEDGGSVGRVGEWSAPAAKAPTIADSIPNPRSAFELGERIPSSVIPPRGRRHALNGAERDEQLSCGARASVAVVRQASQRVRGEYKAGRAWSTQEPLAEIEETLDAVERKALRARKSRKVKVLGEWREAPGRGISVEDALLGMLRSARELDDRTFHSHDDRLSVELDTERDYDAACWEARKDAAYDSRGPLPRRAIGEGQAELAARAHRLTEWLVVHDRRLVVVVRPWLTPDPERSDRWILESRVERTESHFYASVEEAAAAVVRIRAKLEKRGPVRVYRPDPLAHDDALSDAVNAHRRKQREWLKKNAVTTLPSGRRLKVRKEVTA